MAIAGIDYSLCSPAICIYHGDDVEGGFTFNNCSFHYLTDIKKYATTFLENIHGESFGVIDGESSRYDCISSWAVDIILKYGCDQVALEGYSYGSKGKIFHIAENTGILKYKLYQNSIPVDIVAPTTVKKFATGKGNADKEMMHDSFLTETEKNLKKIITPLKKKASNPVSDIVDSYYICKSFYDKLKNDY